MLFKDDVVARAEAKAVRENAGMGRRPLAADAVEALNKKPPTLGFV